MGLHPTVLDLFAPEKLAPMALLLIGVHAPSMASLPVLFQRCTQVSSIRLMKTILFFMCNAAALGVFNLHAPRFFHRTSANKSRRVHYFPFSSARRRAAVVAAVCGVCSTGCGQHVHTLPPPDKIELSTPLSLPLESVSGRPIVSARVNDRGPFKFILDTGATGSVFGESLAREVGLPSISQVMMGRPGSDKPVPATVTRVAKIEIGGLRLEGVIAVFADLSVLHKKESDVQGVLSAAMFQGLLVTFNYPAKKIEFKRGELPAEDRQTIFAWPAAKAGPSFTADVGGQSVPMDLDTGSTSGFVLSTTIANKLAWLQAPSEGAPIRTLDMETKSFTGQMKGIIRVGKFSFQNPRLEYHEGFNNVGYGVLKDFVVTLDSKNRRFELSRD